MIKKAKYKNSKIIHDGIKFDSKKERDRYLHLKKLEEQGKIHFLKMQEPFKLLESVKFEGSSRAKPAVKYVADFTYFTPTNCLVIEDVKSDFTRSLPVYRLKKHMMKALLFLEITEI